MTDADDVQLQIKKKARRRLVGALAFAAFAALVLPMVMDQAPAPPTQEVDLRIPAPDGGKPFAPASQPLPPPEPTPPSGAPAASVNAGAASTAVPPGVPAPAAVQTPRPEAAANPEGKVKGESRPDAQPDHVAEVRPQAETKPVAKPKPAEKSEKNEKSDKSSGKNAKPAGGEDADRVAAILSGKPAPEAGAYVILIGAFSSEANVQNIKAKLAELGIKVYTEPLDSPQGRKTRVRAGPFPKREAAEKALEKMKRIGISGVIAAKQ
jgi:DedD protein